MATQAEIADWEDVLIEALRVARSSKSCDAGAVRKALKEASDAYTQESKTPGGAYKNRNYWSTLGVNASVLGSFVTDPALSKECSDLAILLGIHS